TTCGNDMKKRGRAAVGPRPRLRRAPPDVTPFVWGRIGDGNEEDFEVGVCGGGVGAARRRPGSADAGERTERPAKSRRTVEGNRGGGQARTRAQEARAFRWPMDLHDEVLDP